MGKTRPSAIGGLGGTIVVTDSASLALLDADGLPLGTIVNNLGVGFPFKLTLSTASLDPDVVVEVKNTVGSRWIIETSGGGDVESVTGTSPIEVDNTDPQNPVVGIADDSVVFSVVAGTGITVDNTDPENPVVNADGGGESLAEIYTAGVGTPADNTMVGDYYNVFFDDNGTINSNQNVVGVPVGFDGFSRRVLRWFASPTEVEVDRFVNQNDTQNTEGSIIQTYWNQLTAGPAPRQYGASRWQMQNNPNHDLWYDPQRAGGGFLSQLNLSMLYAGDEAMHQNIHQFLSDGPHLQNIIPPASGGPYAIAGTHYNLFSTSNPANGTAVGVWSFKQGRINFFLDDYNSGTGRGNSHLDIWLTQNATGVNERSMQVMAPTSTQLSDTDTFALKYDLAGDRAQVSSNGGAYANILTPADVAGLAVTSLTGDVTGTGPGATAATLATVNGNVGSFTAANITVNAKGLITAAANGTGGITALTGDVTASGTGSVAATLAAGSATVLNSGTLNAARLPAMTGDVTATAGTNATTLAAGNAGNLNSGTLLAARMPALTGDVTTSAGAVATTIGAGKVTGAMLSTTTGFQPWVTDAVAGSAVQDKATTLVMSGTDQDYEIRGKIVCPNATNVYTLQLNSVATDQSFQRTGVDNSGNAFTDTKTTFEIGDVSTTGSLYFMCRITQMTGMERMVHVSSWQTGGDGTFMYINQGRWNQTTEITAFRVHSSAAGGLGIGTTISARRV